MKKKFKKEREKKTVEKERTSRRRDFQVFFLRHHTSTLARVHLRIHNILFIKIIIRLTAQCLIRAYIFRKSFLYLAEKQSEENNKLISSVFLRTYIYIFHMFLCVA